jgi:lysophospholipase L1-like esterase
MKITRAFPVIIVAAASLAAITVTPPVPAEAQPQTVSVVGDSLIAGRERIYREAFAARAVPHNVSGVGSRALRYGWQCKTPAGLVVRPRPLHSKCKREGLEMIKYLRDARGLGTEVVVALGTNDAGLYPGARSIPNLNEVRKLVGTRKIWIVTVRKLSGGPKLKQWNATAAAWCARDISCALIPWAESSLASNPAVYSQDGVHLTERGAKLRAEMIATVVVGP